jgi:hypothetical protein
MNVRPLTGRAGRTTVTVDDGSWPPSPATSTTTPPAPAFLAPREV